MKKFAFTASLAIEASSLEDALRQIGALVMKTARAASETPEASSIGDKAMKIEQLPDGK